MKKGRETHRAESEDSTRPCPDTDREAEARALAHIYARAIERREQKRMSDESTAGSNTTEAERGDLPGEYHPTMEGGGRHAEED